MQLGRNALLDVPWVGMALLAFLVLVRLPLAAPLLIVAGALLGLLGMR